MYCERGQRRGEVTLFSKSCPPSPKNSMIPMSFAILRGVIEVKFLPRLVKNGRFLKISENAGQTPMGVLHGIYTAFFAICK